MLTPPVESEDVVESSKLVELVVLLLIPGLEDTGRILETVSEAEEGLDTVPVGVEEAEVEAEEGGVKEERGTDLAEGAEDATDAEDTGALMVVLVMDDT